MAIIKRDYRAIADRIEDTIIGKLDTKPRPKFQIIVSRKSPHSCEFVTGPVTPEMDFAAEIFSEFYYKKRLARNASLVRRAG